jgi:hypothetical protein
MRGRFLSYCLLLLSLLAISFSAKAQGTQTEFGKNVLQYKVFEWYYYSSENFDVYFYTGGKELARYVITEGEINLKDLEMKVDYPLGRRVTFIIYNSYTDFRQSNHLLPGEVLTNGGRARIQDSKALVYFNGSHFDFLTQIRSGIAQLMLNDMLYGGSLQERVQNNVLLNLPEWYARGLVSYLAEDWSSQDEDILKNGVLSGRFKRFLKLTDDEATLIGQSLWKYVNDIYGEEALANMLYIMRAHKSIESGFLFVLGKSFQEFYDEWYDYHKRRFEADKSRSNPGGSELTQLKKLFKKGTIARWAISHRGDYAAVVINSQGLSRLWVVDLKTNKKKLVYKEGYRRGDNVIDLNYPVIAWNTRQNQLTVVYEHKSVPTYFQYDAEKKKKGDKQIITRVDRVLSVDYSDNGLLAVMSVVRNGQTDIITFHFRSQQQRIMTDDIYDDLNPKFTPGGGIVFASNRPNVNMARISAEREYIFAPSYDIFYLPDPGVKKLKRVSGSLANETQPSAFDTTYFSYLTDENGIQNYNAARLDSIFQYSQVVALYKDTSIRQNDTLRFYNYDYSYISIHDSILKDTNLAGLDTSRIYKDTFYTYPISDFSENVQSYAFSYKTEDMYELFLVDNKYKLLRRRMPENIEGQTIKRSPGTFYRRKPAEQSLKTRVNTYKDVFADYPVSEDTNARHKDTSHAANDYFQTGFPAPPKEEVQAKNQLATAGDKQESNRRVKFGSANLYFLNFTTDQIVPLQLDNSLANSPYIPFNDGEDMIYTPTIRGMFKLGLSDMFKDYRIVGGFRVMANFRGSEYFMTFDNVKNRLDKRLFFFRRGEVKNDEVGYYRSTTHELRPQLKWPFSETSALRGEVFGRMDKKTYLTGTPELLQLTVQKDYWAGGKLEYVFDNVIPKGMNFYNGTRLKFYSEYFNGFTTKNSRFVVGGADIRHYQKISRQIIWANRFAGASSIGKTKIAYFMGGVDNWLLPRYDNTNIVDPSQNYAFKTLATNVRGFDQNVRNGSSYALINSEIRVPVIKYIFNRPFRSTFFENFQAVGFADAGMAWNGLNPFSIDNAFNKRIIDVNNFHITVISLRDPVVYGYGFGFRSVFLGYFVRLDYAWGVDDGVRGPRRTYLSMGYDF